MPVVPRRAARAWWKLVNPPTRALAGWLPFWVLLETTGRKSGRPRRTPLANGPLDDAGMYLIAVHGASAGFVRNIHANPRVRLKRRGSWRTGTARAETLDEAVVARFSRYARSGLRLVGENPQLVRIQWDRSRVS